MDELAPTLNLLLPPKLPDSLSEADRNLIFLLLESVKQQLSPYSGSFKAQWLLNPFDSERWETTNRGREELVAGTWKNNISIDWRVLLPNGLLLTDARYELLLTCVKKIAFFMRSNLISGNSAPQAWNVMTYGLIGIARWSILHEAQFQPALHGFRLIDQAALEWLLSQVAEGGWTQAMQIPKRILTKMYRGAHGTQCPQPFLDNPLEIPKCEIGHLVKWLDLQGAYIPVHAGTHFRKRYISREWLARLINENKGSLSGVIITRLCRQFEPDFAGNPLLVSVKQTTELPPQWIVSGQDIHGGNTHESIKGTTKLFAAILGAHRLLPDFVPEPTTISIVRASRLTANITKPSGHTLLMPVNTGLAYLNVAMRFVNLYGGAIIGLFLAVLSSTKMRRREHNIALKRHASDWCVATGEPITSVLNISEFRRQDGHRDFERFRSNPTLDDALRVLIGSCIICIAQLKPSREEELTHLKRNCIRHDSSGYWFNFNLGKSNVKGVEAWQELDRPIPVISAMAIHLLQRLGGGDFRAVRREPEIRRQFILSA
jgi:hypothetical protein